MNWKKSLSIAGTFIMLVGQNIAGVTAFAETISNSSSNTEDVYFEKENIKISELNVDQGQDGTITFVDENKEDQEATVVLSSSTTLNQEETNTQLGDASSINYDQNTNQVKITFKNKEQEVKRTNLVLTAKDTSSNDQTQMFAQVNRQDGQMYQSAPVSISIILGESSEIEQSVQIEEKDEEPAQKITPYAGNLNVDLDIAAVSASVLSGASADYQLQFKVTGSQVVYHNAKITVDLPSGATLAQNLTELAIAGVVPTKEKDQLIWSFDTLTSGQAYTVTLKLATKNGTTPNGTELSVTSNFTADEFPVEAKSTAKVTVTAGSTLAAAKKYISTKDKNGQDKDTPPTAGDTGTWSLSVTANNKDTGLAYFKEGSTIKIFDVIPDGLTYVSDNAGGKYDPATRTVTWEIPAPSIAEQENAQNKLFEKDIRVTTKFNDDIENMQQFKNVVNASAEDISDKEIKTDASASVSAGVSDPNAPELPSGSIWVQLHDGPIDGLSNVGYTGKNPDPSVYDWADLGFYININANRANSPIKDFDKYEVNYLIDPNLNLDRISIPSYVYRPDTTEGVWDKHDMKGPEHPNMDIYVTIDGKEQKIVSNAEDATTYVLSDLSIPKGTHVEKIRYHWNYAPAGMYAQGIRSYYSIEKGFTGRVINQSVWTIEGYNSKGDPVTIDTTDSSKDPNNFDGERYAEVIKQPEGSKIVATSAIWFDTQKNGIVTLGDNRITGSFNNNATSNLPMNGPLEAMVLLPEGVKVNEKDPNYRFQSPIDGKWDEGNSSVNGNAKIVTNNYNNTNRQLVKVTWTAEQMLPHKSAGYGFSVIIDAKAPVPLRMDTRGYSGKDELTVPSGASSLTDSYLEIDKDDLNGDGDSTQKRVLSSNEYRMVRESSIATEKLVKGEQDKDFSKMGHTLPGGAIDYQLSMTNNGDHVGAFTMLEVLPNVGDLGITDNQDRGSLFTPTLTGPVSLPEKWQGHATVKYSTATNPSRKDLSNQVIYPGTTEELTDPSGAEDPKWMAESEVSDWSSIHSFMIQMDGAEWVTGEQVTFNFSMKAPTNVSMKLLDQKIPDNERAAWNSFAYTANNSQVVEPERVGVVVNGENPDIEKDIEGKEHLDLTNRNDEFNWHVNALFGNTTGSWEQARIKDKINDVFDIVKVTVVDETGKDVMGNGTLSTTNNEIVFELNKKDGSYAYLAGHTYTMTITTKIKDSVTDEELAPYIKDGGIPNQADLEFGNAGDVVHSEKPTVTPPPVDPDIEKDIEGKEHLDLTNRNDEFNWHVNALFGNTTGSWEQARIKDKINDVFDIVKVTVVDETGKDVMGNGTLSTTNNEIVFELNKKDGSYAYLAGHTYTMTITTKIKDSVTDEELAPYIKDGGIPNQADLEFGNAGDVVHSEKPTVTPPPVDPDIEKDIEGKEHLDLTNRNDEFNWHVNALFGNTTGSWEQARIKDKINDVFDIVKVTVVDETGKDVMGNGTLSTTNNEIVFELNKKEDSYAYLGGHTYTMTITTKIKDSVTDEELAPYIKDGGIPNQADLEFGNAGDVVHSEKPTVIPPTEEPEIHKDVEGKEHLDLANRNQQFEWHINALFGNKTSTWKQASITDSINEFLDIINVTVVDETGKDVTENGTLSIENNKIVFELNKKEDSYAYLGGHTYTMTITTKIKDSVTDEELAPYIKDGGIPNQADLNFGDQGDQKHSEIPTVIPPKNHIPTVPNDKNDSGMSIPSKGNFPYTGENQLLSTILIIVGSAILVILSMYSVMKRKKKLHN